MRESGLRTLDQQKERSTFRRRSSALDRKTNHRGQDASHLFGNPAVLIHRTRGFASPDYSGFALSEIEPSINDSPLFCFLTGSGFNHQVISSAKRRPGSLFSRLTGGKTSLDASRPIPDFTGNLLDVMVKVVSRRKAKPVEKQGRKVPGLSTKPTRWPSCRKR
jgi:hypothetical protein